MFPRIPQLRVLSRIAVVACALLTFPAPRVDAQSSGPTFRHLDEKAGLSNNSITCIMEDRKGFMWIGTRNGLNRFDGYAFTRFLHSPSDAGSISASSISAMVIDKARRLWVATSDSGVNLYDRNSGRFSRIRTTSPVGQALSDDRIRCMMEDSKGTIWIGTYNGLNALDPATRRIRQYLPNPADSTSLRNESISSIDEDGNGIIWIGTRTGLSCFDRRTGSFSTPVIRGLSKAMQTEEYITTLCFDRNGTLWYGTGNGVVHATSGGSGALRTYPIASSRALGDLEENEIGAMYEDDRGTLWVGSFSGGLNRYDPESDTFVQYLHDPANPLSLSGNHVTSIHASREGIVWVGTGEDGLNLLVEKPRLFTAYPLKRREDGRPAGSADTKAKISAFAVDHRGVTWVGTIGKGLATFDRARGILRRFGDSLRSVPELSSGSVSSLLVDSRRNLWVGFYGSGLIRVTPGTNAIQQFRHNSDQPGSISSDYVTALSEDEEGTLWVGTMGGGLQRHYPESGSFKSYRHIQGDSASLSSDMIVCLTSIEGTLWVGTYDQGVSVFDMHDSHVYHYRHSDANRNTISNNHVASIARDASGVIWIGTFDGLNAFDPLTRTFHRYGMEDGLTSDAVVGILPDSHGKIWVSTSSGLNKVGRIAGMGHNLKMPGPSLRVRKYFGANGLQANEFSLGAAHRDAKGLLYFGGAEGFNVFHPDSIRDIPYVPPVVITDFLVSTGSVQVGDGSNILTERICEADTVILPESQKIFSLEFAALSNIDPENNLYAYMLEGFDDHWHTTNGRRRFVTYTNLSPGEYVFRVRGCSAEGVWNEEGARLVIIILPPWWRTIYAYISYGLLLAGFIVGADRLQRSRVIKKERREALIREVELRAEAAEQNARMKEAQAEAANAMTKALEAENRKNEIELEKARELEKAYSALDESHKNLKDAQDQLVHSEKMASLGALTAGIAHEIKNPLNFVNNFARLSKRSIGELKGILDANQDQAVKDLGPDVTEILDELEQNSERIYEHGQRADSIVRGMLLHSRGDSGTRAKADLNAVLDEAMNLAYHGMRATKSDFNTTIVREYDKAVGDVEVVPQEISRVFLNLLNNAMYVVYERTLEQIPGYEPTVTARSLRVNDTVYVMISDNGRGMSEEVRKKVFEPFFTTKPAGSGTGLGLSMSYDIVVEGHRGSISVDSAPGEGATFTVVLPAPL
ncbi:MAG: hypothetical protein IPP94_04905 [Ignavibacteria bacterium]|nr:hypothetical protein [Ignavibacteria bacterium]